MIAEMLGKRQTPKGVFIIKEGGLVNDDGVLSECLLGFIEQ
ncbi:MAG: hypothetical protein ACRCVV_16625 [Shewanella sp.]